MHPATLPEDALLKDCEVIRGKASGPGGQHRNKVETHVEIRHKPSGITGQAGERRSQNENRKVALRRLRLNLAVGLREPVPRGEIRSEAWRRHADEGTGRVRCSDKSPDFPTLLAEALDVLADSGWEPSEAGLRLGVTGTQLMRLVGKYAPAHVVVNESRLQRGLRKLR
ncbi:MAG: peptide chain release factor-like protein [Phycisphaerales bacterium]